MKVKKQTGAAKDFSQYEIGVLQFYLRHSFLRLDVFWHADKSSLDRSAAKCVFKKNVLVVD